MSYGEPLIARDKVLPVVLEDGTPAYLIYRRDLPDEVFNWFKAKGAEKPQALQSRSFWVMGEGHGHISIGTYSGHLPEVDARGGGLYRESQGIFVGCIMADELDPWLAPLANAYGEVSP